MATQNFEDWLSVADIEDNIEAIDQLYEAVSYLHDCGIFIISEAQGCDNGWILNCVNIKETLHIANENARNTLLWAIRKKYNIGDDEPSWYAMKKATEKEE